MLMTFILHPLSNYNSIIKPRAQFLLSLLEDISIDFPSHFILSLIDVYRDMATRDKVIFPSAITWILRHFSIPFPVSPHFFCDGCHRHCYRLTERGTAQTEAAPYIDGKSSSFYRSIHLRSFVFCGWSDT